MGSWSPCSSSKWHADCFLWNLFFFFPFLGLIVLNCGNESSPPKWYHCFPLLHIIPFLLLFCASKYQCEFILNLDHWKLSFFAIFPAGRLVYEKNFQGFWRQTQSKNYKYTNYTNFLWNLQQNVLFFFFGLCVCVIPIDNDNGPKPTKQIPVRKPRRRISCRPWFCCCLSTWNCSEVAGYFCGQTSGLALSWLLAEDSAVQWEERAPWLCESNGYFCQTPNGQNCNHNTLGSE